jgi:predicted transcriptional regulator of viral defense system
MAIRNYLDTHQVFTAAEFAEAFPGSMTDVNLLARAARSGAVDRVRRGLYVSKTGQFGHAQADPFDVAAAAAEDAVFCFLSALQLHGVLHNVVNVTQFYSGRQLSRFEYAGHAYQPRRRPKGSLDTQRLVMPSGRSYAVTTKEQTILDGLARPGVAGGVENLLRSVSGLVYLDPEKLVGLPASASTRAKLGWILDVKREEWRVSEALLAWLSKGVSGGPYYFSSSREPKDSHWVNRWRLYLPYPEQEMAAWLEQ